MKVLLLDKNLFDLQFMVSQLQLLEFEVAHTSNIKDMTQMYLSFTPDIIVMDPNFSGVESHEIIKTLRDVYHSDTPILFVQEEITSDDVISALSLGCEYLTKPINHALFKAKLRSMQRLIEMKQKYVIMSKKLQQASDELKHFTHIDNLTGLINRSYLNESMKVEISRGIRYQQPIALVYIEVDGFKAFRDTYGLQQSDNCLKNIAQILTRHCRRSMDIAAHCGGDLFALVFPDTTSENALKMTRRICESVEAAQMPHINSTVSNVCTVTVGLTSSVPHAGEKKENLFKLADIALMRARKAGHNCVELVNHYTVNHEPLKSNMA